MVTPGLVGRGDEGEREASQGSGCEGLETGPQSVEGLDEVCERKEREES